MWALLSLRGTHTVHPQFAPVAQRIEHLTTDQKVGGSNPSGRATVLPLKSGPGAPSLTLTEGSRSDASQPTSQPWRRPQSVDLSKRQFLPLN